MAHARDGISRWSDFYNQRRRHQALEKQTPATVYYQSLNAEVQAYIGITQWITT